MEVTSLFLFLKGLLIGFAIAAPVGPIGILVIQRSLYDGFKIGFMTGLGAVLADGFYGFIAAFGLTTISAFLVQYQSWIRLIGGIFLIVLGTKLFLTKPIRKKSALKKERSSFHALFTTFLLTVTNPATILSFIAIFAGLGIGTTDRGYYSSFILVLGILAGSACWWLLLSATVSLVLHHRLNPYTMRLINKISGAIIFVFGIAALIFAGRV